MRVCAPEKQSNSLNQAVLLFLYQAYLQSMIVKQYLLPNYVASCCKRLGIDGIKYLSGNYACYVTWKDDYFDFVGRVIIEPE